jgi:hypothetical protein
MKIDALLNKYFEGETSCEEEQWIRNYFSNEKVPEHLLCYKPMFTYFDNEITTEQAKKTEQANKRVIPRRKTLIYTLSGIAACVVMAIGISTFLQQSDDSCKRNYVVINGKCYTDEATIKAYANASLQEVATSKDEVFTELFKD